MPTLEQQLILHEGIRLKPYRCTAGKLTIGIGRNLEDNGITEEEAGFLFDQDIASVIAGLDKYIPWWRELQNDERLAWSPRQKVLLDMGFNLGVAGLLKFKNTLRAVQEERYADAAKGMLASKWAKQVGKRAVRLARMMETGEDYAA